MAGCCRAITVVCLLVLLAAPLTYASTSAGVSAGQGAGSTAQQSSSKGQAAGSTGAQAQTQSKQHESKGHYKEHTDCPTPQPPNAVQEVYLGHGSFVWSQMAAETAAASKAGRKSQLSAKREQPRRPVRRHPGSQGGRRGGQRAATQQAKAATQAKSMAAPKGSSGAGAAKHQPPKSTKSHPAAEAQVGVAATAAATAAAAAAQLAATVPIGAITQGSGSGVTVTPAAVTDPDFLLPITAVKPSGKGFFGTWDHWTPDNALAVAPHPTDADVNYVLHCVNSVCEIFFATKSGHRVHQEAPTKVYILDIMAAASFNISNIDTTDPTAFWDPAARRFVVLWTSVVTDPSQPFPSSAPLYVAVSQGSNPLGKWAVWVLESRPAVAPGLPFCKDLPGMWYIADYPQASFTNDGLFISVGAFCNNIETGDETEFLSTLFAYPKADLYAQPPPSATSPAGSSKGGGKKGAAAAPPSIRAATYLAPASWYASVPLAERAEVGDTYKPFNSFIMPVWPQAPEDAARPPLFVMKVDNARISVATLTDEPLSKMRGVDSAPKLLATVGGKGADFSNAPGQPEGDPVMLQPDTEATLDAGSVGMDGGTYGARSYYSVQHKGKLYTTLLEYWGVNKVRLPSIYWGIFETSKHLCRVRRHDWGVLASRDGLALSYPVIGGREKGGALLAYAYSGASPNLPNNLGPAYAGVATTVVGTSASESADGGAGSINVVKAGSTDIVDPDKQTARYGDYSAAAFIGGNMWFAVLTANPLPDADALPRYTWISVAKL